MNLGQCPYISPLFTTAFFSGLAHLFFLCFCCGTIITQNWWSGILGGNSCLPENGLKRPKGTHFVHLSITIAFFSGLVQFFLLYFAWSWGKISTQIQSQIFWEMFAYANVGFKDPKWSDLSVCLLWQNFFSGLAH